MLTYRMVHAEIVKKYGEKMGKRYRPSNCRTLNSWRENGFFVKKGSRAIRSITFIPKTDANGQTTVYRKNVNLFFYPDLERIIK